jgi:hypothetical protein
MKGIVICDRFRHPDPDKNPLCRHCQEEVEYDYIANCVICGEFEPYHAHCLTVINGKRYCDYHVLDAESEEE